MPAVVIETGPLRNRRFKLPEKGSVTIGRDPQCTLVLPDEILADVQCILRFQSGHWVLENRDKDRRTFVNDRRATRTALNPDDVVRVGQTLLTYVVEDKDPLLSTQVAGYSIQKRIGRGAMGTVYKARQLSLDRTVAVKFLSPHLARNEELVRGFLQEARAAARLNHPNVVQVYDAGKEGSHFYISMEYLEKGTLENLLEKEKRIAAPRAVAMAIQAARALAFAQQNHIVHRDIKPANLFIAADDSIKVGDLGIATDLRAEKSAGAGGSAGSPHYMAPEQIRGGEVDHRADIYALGCTLYRIVAGTPPFTGKTVKEILMAKLREDPVPLERRVADLPKGLSDVVQKMISRSPDDRYASALEVEADLSDIEDLTDSSDLSDHSVRTVRTVRTATPPAAEKQRSPPSVPTWGNPRARMVAAAIVLLVVTIAFFLLDTNGTSERDPNATERPPTSVATTLPDSSTVTRESGAPDPEETLAPEERWPTEAPPSRADPARANPPESINDIFAAYDEGRLRSGEAQIQLRAIQRRNLGNQTLVEEAHKLMAYIREGVTSRMIEKAKEHRKVVDSLVREGRLIDAAKSIEEFKAREQATKSLLAEQTQLLQDATAEAIAAVSKQVDAFLNERDPEAARGVLSELVSRLPRVARSAGTRSAMAGIEQRIATFETAATERAQADVRMLAQAILGIRHALADFDFERAETLLTQLGQPLTQGDTWLPRRLPWRPGARQLAVIREEIDSSRAVWASLQEALQSIVRRGKELKIAFAEHRAGEKKVGDGVYRVSGLAAPFLMLQRGADQKADVQTAAVLALKTKVLLELAGRSSPLTEEARRRGLGMLLLLRRGAERARGLLLHPELKPPALQAGREALKSARSVWLSARLRSVETVCSRWRSAGADVAADSWNCLAEDLIKIHATWREREDFEEKRGDFVSLYAKVREEILLQSSRESFFHAGRVRFQPGGVVTLTYDFRTAEELLDFHPVGAIENILERNKSKNSIRLRGEYRILIGEPFEGFLRISGTAEALAENAPNLNFALWTHEGDAVTFPDRNQIDLAKRTRGETGIGDYFVVAHGYRLLGTLSAARRRRTRFDLNRLPLHFSQPSFAIISGYRDSTLHRNVYSEVIWERPLGDRFRSNFRFDVAMEGGELKWTVNRAKPLFGADKKLGRLKENAPYSGSVTLFTNGSEVVFSKIELRGKTRPEWFRLRARARAEEDAKRLGE